MKQELKNKINEIVDYNNDLDKRLRKKFKQDLSNLKFNNAEITRRIREVWKNLKKFEVIYNKKINFIFKNQLIFDKNFGGMNEHLNIGNGNIDIRDKQFEDINKRFERNEKVNNKILISIGEHLDGRFNAINKRLLKLEAKK